MGTLKSLTEFNVGLLEAFLLNDFPRMHGQQVEFLRDFEVVKKRVRLEGISFLTKTLPRFAKSIDLALQGKEPLMFTSFKRRGKHVLPAFLWGLTRLVFDSFSGMILEEPSITAINDLRQITYLLYKLEVEYDQLSITNVLDRFVSTDQALAFTPGRLGGLSKEHRRILAVGKALLTSVFKGMDVTNIKPKHGPGAVATGEKPWQKFRFKRFFRGINRVFPIRKYYFLNLRHLTEELESFFAWTRCEYGVSKVTLVPKDSRGPRLISMEPLEYQWIQQGLKSAMYNWIESHPMTSGHVNFTDQSINRALALKGSEDGSFVTLDLKDASDSVSLELVKFLFADTPLYEALLATRTPVTELPDGQCLFMRKFAPMGSAVCFPVEALVFWAIGAASINVLCGVPLPIALRQIWVYGDDIIVHKGAQDALLTTFPAFDLKFNEGKCCVDGFFRESCGCDAYKGQDVTPLKMRKLHPVTQADGAAFLSYVEYSNTLWQKCFYSAAQYISDYLEDVFGPLPYDSERREVLRVFGSDAVELQLHQVPALRGRGRVSMNPKVRRKWNTDLQCWSQKVWTSRGVKKLTSPDHWSELFRSFVYRSKEVRAGTYGVPRRVTIVKRWWPKMGTAVPRAKPCNFA